MHQSAINPLLTQDSAKQQSTSQEKMQKKQLTGSCDALQAGLDRAQYCTAWPRQLMHNTAAQYCPSECAALPQAPKGTSHRQQSSQDGHTCSMSDMSQDALQGTVERAYADCMLHLTCEMPAGSKSADSNIEREAGQQKPAVKALTVTNSADDT